jgi:hypothetical protein
VFIYLCLLLCIFICHSFPSAFLYVIHFQVQGVHIVHKGCIDRGELTSGKLKRDSVEISSSKVQGVHRKNSLLTSERNRVSENSIELCQAGIERVQVCTERNLWRVQGEEYQRNILTEMLNTL